MSSQLVVAKFRLTAWLRKNLAWAFDPATYQLRPQILDLVESPQGGEFELRAPGNQLRRRNVAVRLPKEMLLQKTFRFPAHALSELDGAISVKLRQMLPMSGAGLVGRRVGVNILGSEIVAQVAVARESTIEAAHSLCRNWNLKVHSVFCDGSEGPVPFDRAQDNDRVIQLWAGLTIFFLCTAVPIGNFRLLREIENIQVRTRSVQDEVSALNLQLAGSNAEQSSTSSDATAASDLKQLRKGRVAISLLNHFAAKLPNSVWVSELLVQGDYVTATLLTLEDVIQLQARFAEDPNIQSLSLEGGVQLDPSSGLSRMTVSFDFVEPQ